MKLWPQAPEVMVHFIFPFISFISLLAGFHSLNRMPLVSEMVHTRGLSFAAQRKIDQLPNRTIDQSTKPLLDVIILYGGSWKTRSAIPRSCPPHKERSIKPTMFIAANMPAHVLNQNRVATVLLISVLANRVVLTEKSLEHGAHL